MMSGQTRCVHFYYGGGKGKTSAAMGLALRAAGRGIPVLVVQFLKDGSSGEVEMLKKLGVEVIALENLTGFTFQMTDAERDLCAAEHNRNLAKAAAWCGEEGKRGLLVLDEIGSALAANMVDREALFRFLDDCKGKVEIVLTGHKPDEELLRRADYVTRMKKIRHPFDSGMAAREGVEF